MKKLQLIMLIIVLSISTAAFGSYIAWERHRLSSGDQKIVYIQQLNDGSYICTGRDTGAGGPAGGSDVYLEKTDDEGYREWRKWYGFEYRDEGVCVRVTRNSGFVFLGFCCTVEDSNQQIFIIKTDLNGDSTWSRIYGDSLIDSPEEIRQTEDGGYILISNSDYGTYKHGYILRLDSNGDSLRSLVLDDSYDMQLKTMQITKDGNYIILGDRKPESGDPAIPFLLKINDNLDILWSHDYEFLTFSISVCQAFDDGYVFVGRDGLLRMVIVKTDINGDTLGTQSYNVEEFGFTAIKPTVILQSREGGFFVTGSVYYSGGNQAFYMLTDVNGELKWIQFFEDGDLSPYIFHSEQVINGGYILAGKKLIHQNGQGQVWLAKVGPPKVTIKMFPAVLVPIVVPQGGSFQFAGILRNTWDFRVKTDLWIMLVLPDGNSYGPLERYDDISLSRYEMSVTEGIIQDIPAGAPLGTYTYISYVGSALSDPNDADRFEFIVVSGAGRSTGWDIDGWSLTYDNGTLPVAFEELSNYPNPFNNQTDINIGLPEAGKVSLDIYNVLGQKVETLINSYMPQGQHTITWDASSYSSGIYFYKLTTNDKTMTKRMMLLK